MHNLENLYDLNDETAVIGAFMFRDDSDEALEAISILKPDEFYLPEHRKIWAAICSLVTRGFKADWMSVDSSLRDTGDNQAANMVMQAANFTPSQVSMVQKARRIKKFSQLRSAMNSMSQAMEIICGYGDPEQRLKSSLNALSSVGDEQDEQDIKESATVLESVLTMMKDAISRKDGLLGISSGFEAIDRMTQGFQAGDLIVVAAPPSMGKTTLTLNFGEYAAFLDPNPKRVLFFSLEMSAEQLMQKTLANLGNIYLKKVRTGETLKDDAGAGRVSEAMGKIMARSKNFFIDDKGGQTVPEMHARAKRAQMRMGGLDLIIVDYLHKIEAEGESEVMQVRAKIRGMKNLAKKMKCPVICLSQLNRGLVGRPEMKNLLGSSAIEQESDCIMFIYDEDYQGERGINSISEVIFAKNRMGETGSIFLQPELAMSRFSSTDRKPAPKEEPKKFAKRDFK
jgi:replicative DNA helicase